MSEEEKLQLENECLLKYSKAQMIQKYIDELEENKKLNNIINNDDVYGYIKHLEDLTTKKDNIINELEKTLLEWHKYWEDDDSYSWQYKDVYDYLQELKGSDKNGRK